MNATCQYFQTIFISLVGTFTGAMLAFLSDILIENHRNKKSFAHNMNTLLLILRRNNDVLKKIKADITNNELDNVEIYDKIFGRYNFKYQLQPINYLFENIQNEVYNKYVDRHDIMLENGVYTTLYNLLCDILEMQMIVVNLQGNPVKREDNALKNKIVDEFESYYKMYSEKYKILNNYGEMIK